MLFYRFAQLKFWVTATDQHGVHSPFVYRYVTQCLYSAPRFKPKGPTNILLKTIAYFKLKEVQLITEDDRAVQQITSHSDGVSIVGTSQKLIYLDRLNDKTIGKYLIHNKEIINDTIVYIPNIYKTRDRFTCWEKIKELEKVTVSVDMFYGGLIFFRREQAEEHFKIRI